MLIVGYTYIKYAIMHLNKILSWRIIMKKIICNDEITASEKIYTHDTPEWVDLNEIDKINFRHSVSLAEILAAYNRVN